MEYWVTGLALILPPLAVYCLFALPLLTFIAFRLYAAAGLWVVLFWALYGGNWAAVALFAVSWPLWFWRLRCLVARDAAGV